MECIGFKETAIKYFQSYLSNRKFFVAPENVFSDAALINCGVPQGSILGLLLLLIYINYLPQALNETGSYLFADDTCFFYQDKDVEKTEEVLSKEFLSLCEWFIDNTVSYQFILGMIIQKQFLYRIKSPPKLSISYGDYSLKQHNTAEYLGSYLDSNHHGESMSCRVLKEISTKVNFLWRQSNYLNYPSRRLLSNNLIQPHFDYGCTSWYPLLSKNLKTKSQIAQNKYICFCLELQPRGHINPSHFRKTNWLPVEGRLELCISTIHYCF